MSVIRRTRGAGALPRISIPYRSRNSYLKWIFALHNTQQICRQTNLERLTMTRYLSSALRQTSPSRRGYWKSSVFAARGRLTGQKFRHIQFHSACIIRASALPHSHYHLFAKPSYIPPTWVSKSKKDLPPTRRGGGGRGRLSAIISSSVEKRKRSVPAFDSEHHQEAPVARHSRTLHVQIFLSIWFHFFCVRV